MSSLRRAPRQPDRLRLHGLAVACRLGVFEWERRRPQRVRIDLELPIDAARAAWRDAIEDAVDYARLVADVKQHVRSRTYRLMETLAQDVAALILGSLRPRWVQVRVTKRAPPFRAGRALAGIDSASVEILRHSASLGTSPESFDRLRIPRRRIPSRVEGRAKRVEGRRR